jgi:hypothetical protein
MSKVNNGDKWAFKSGNSIFIRCWNCCGSFDVRAVRREDGFCPKCENIEIDLSDVPYCSILAQLEKAMSDTDVKIKFDCNGFSAPAYSCSKSGDNSGVYVQSTDYDALVEQNKALIAALDHIKKHQETVVVGMPQLSATWQIAVRALEQTKTK